MTETPERPLEIRRDGRVAVVRLNRPKALNALNAAMLEAFLSDVAPMDADPDVGCIVVTGSERAFAAGADVKEMASKTFAEAAEQDLLSAWDRFADMRTPRIAAVSGFALGGGCELAMMCDLIIAGRSARFGQPEIKLGTIPGLGGTQRLTKLVGKAKAMDLVLTGRMMSADEAERAGLVARVVDDSEVLDASMEAAQTIASYGAIAVRAAREAVDRALETPLSEGLRYERRAFHALFATEDQTEGMTAFVEKRAPNFRNR